MDQQNERVVVIGGIDVQATKIAISIFRAEELEKAARSLLAEASEIRRATKPVIRIELQDDGLFSMQAWKGDRLDSSYPPRDLGSVLREISVVVQELQQPDVPSSPDKHAR